MATIYMDHAATTPLDEAVLTEMMPWLTTHHGNPSSPYGMARRARAALDEARERVAAIVGAHPAEIYFTSGATEALNLAVKGVAYAHKDKGRHIVVSAVEHQAVLSAAQFLAKHGWRVTELSVDPDGLVAVDDFNAALTEETVLAAVMYANNEIGTIQPVSRLARVAAERGVPFLVDAVQAVGMLPVRVDDIGCRLLALSSHKFYGPKGVGALYVDKDLRVESHVHGGGQERGLRGGTENVAGIVGFAKALELADASRKTMASRLTALRDQLIDAIFARLPDAILNGHRDKRLPNNVNFSFPGIDGESLLLNLDLAGVAGSGGSACTSGSLAPSHVLLALGLPRRLAGASLRLTLGKDNTTADVAEVARIVEQTVGRLRERAALAAQFSYTKE